MSARRIFLDFNSMAAMALLLTASASADEPPTPPASQPERIEIKLSHRGDVFGEGPEWDRQYAREALQIFRDLRPDPDWEAKLKALPDNSWLKCSPKGEQEPEIGRAEVPMVYAADAQACMFCCGCTSPGYSSDTWLYKTGANQWVQMWPNFIKGSAGEKLNKGPAPRDRPMTRCSLGLAYDCDRKQVLLHGGANVGRAGQVTWQYDPATNQWDKVAPQEAGPQRYEANCVGFVPGFGLVEVDGANQSRTADTWVYRPVERKWEKLTTHGSPPGGQCSTMVWASGPKRLLYWAPPVSQLWAFDPQTLSWEDISPPDGPSPAGFYRQGMAYDSTNNVLIMFGSKDEQRKLSQGPWVYSFQAKTWTDMKPAAGPGRGHGQQMLTCYDSKYNVVVIAASGRGTWVYRYRQGKQ